MGLDNDLEKPSGIRKKPAGPTLAAAELRRVWRQHRMRLLSIGQAAMNQV